MTSCVPYRAGLKVPPFKLWHVSPIKTNHLLLNILKTPINKGSHQSRRRTFKSLKTLPESSSKVSKNINCQSPVGFKLQSFKELLHQDLWIGWTFIFQSLKFLLESSSKASKNLKNFDLQFIVRSSSKTLKKFYIKIFKYNEHAFKVLEFYWYQALRSPKLQGL